MFNLKSCPGDNWFGGNSVEACKNNFIPLIKRQMDIEMGVLPEENNQQIKSEPEKLIVIENWKVEAMKYLKDNGFIKSDHEPDEMLTLAVFGAIMKNKGW